MFQNRRCVAQPGRAPGLGPGGRMFESCHTDQRHCLDSSGVERLLYTERVRGSKPCPGTNKEGWMSGLNQQFAKLRGAVRCPEGSNPSPSTKKIL